MASDVMAGDAIPSAAMAAAAMAGAAKDKLSTQPPGSPPVAAPLKVATPEQRAKIHATAQAFEAQLLSMMMQPMFKGLQTDGPFGGGQGEESYRSFLVDAVGKQTASHGGIGLAAPVMREMLKMQGLQ